MAGESGRESESTDFGVLQGNEHARLAHLQRLALLGRLTAEMTHELGQPLSAIRSFSEAALYQLRGDAQHNQEQVADALATILVQAGRAQQMIKRVSMFATRGSGTKERFDLWGTIREVVSLLEFEADRLTVKVQLPQQLSAAIVFANRLEIEQVLVNLVHNALESVAAGPDGPRCVTLDIVSDSASHRIEVEDTGLGIRRDEQDRLFDRFFTTKPQGMGLGLAISRAIVEAHGGRIWADPNEGPGATFCFTLPAAS